MAIHRARSADGRLPADQQIGAELCKVMAIESSRYWRNIKARAIDGRA